MFKAIFSNRYAALIWLALTLLSAAAFVGKGGGLDALSETTQKIRGQQDILAGDKRGTPSDAASAEEEEPAIEPSETASPKAGDIITGEDGRQYKIVQAPPSPEPAATQAPAE